MQLGLITLILKGLQIEFLQSMFSFLSIAIVHCSHLDLLYIIIIDGVRMANKFRQAVTCTESVKS